MRQQRCVPHTCIDLWSKSIRPVRQRFWSGESICGLVTNIHALEGGLWKDAICCHVCHCWAHTYVTISLSVCNYRVKGCLTSLLIKTCFGKSGKKKMLINKFPVHVSEAAAYPTIMLWKLLLWSDFFDVQPGLILWIWSNRKMAYYSSSFRLEMVKSKGYPFIFIHFSNTFLLA